jgi:hypothetical protein
VEGFWILGFKMKNAQITPMIILIIAVVLGIGIFYILPGNNIQNIEPNVKPIYNFVSECIKKTTGEGILLVSSHGGYYQSPEGSLDNGIAYYLINGRSHQPSKDRVSNEIGDYISQNMHWCINDFENFPDFEIEDNQITSEVVIREDSVKIELKYPLVVSKGDDTYNFENYLVEVPARIGLMYDSATYLMKDQIDHPKSLCIACVHDINEEYNFEVDTTTLTGNDVLFTIKDNDILVNGEEVVFAFVNRLEDL